MSGQDDTQIDANPGGYSVRDVHTGAFGTGSSAIVGAIGERSRGFVTTAGDAAAQQRLAELLDLLETLRDELEVHRSQVGELHDSLTDRVDEIQEDLEERKPPGRVLRKLGDLAKAVEPFRAIAEIVEKLVAMVRGDG
ncbi:hypothetical protein [Glycomyces sp. NRRL B-16210]|uniref:hypothetical protein n=1 Tax=Glycomyces sp. NRRL B-16210 TaxID=1463821 RepID=UPI00055249BC|nr:hypothetical protein [Glycomyces sp. NRRL B-16210]